MPDRNEVMMKKLFSKIANSMTIDPAHGVLVLENPGTLLDPNYDPRNADDRYDWSRLISVIPAANWIYEATGSRVSDLWEIILRDKVLPTVTLTARERAELNTAYGVVRRPNGQPSDKFRYYRSYERAHATAEDAVNRALQDYHNSGTPVPPGLRRDVQIALEDWLAFGYKDEVETAVAKIDSIQGRDPANWWATLNQRFAESRETSGTGLGYYRVGSEPPREALDPGIRWSDFTFNESDYEYQRESTQVRAGGGLSVNFGLWRASAGGSYSRDQGFVRSNVEGISISFEARRVAIDNYWLNPLVFQTRTWGWGRNTAGSGLGYVCDGNPSSHNGLCGGVMPLMPVGILLAKNVRINGAFSEQERSWFREQVTARASFGFGPFSIGGYYSKRTERDYASGSASTTGVESPHMQILGWFCKPLGKTPDPDLGLEWPSEPDQPDHSRFYRRSLQGNFDWSEPIYRAMTEAVAVR